MSGPAVPTDDATLDGVPAVGTVVESKYEIERVLGVGGMGVVVAARHVQLGQRVAIKFMRGLAAEDATAVDRFLREARAAVALSSEHVTRVLDVGRLSGGAPYIVMEHLSGVDLGEVLRQHGPIATVHAVNSVLQACEAIAEAHAIGIIHRDLKPANLFVTRRNDGTPLVKVLDFGISKRSDFDAVLGRATLTPTGYLMGSPAYMSPEQVRSPKSVDARTDVWALGVILYETLTGVAPFAGETVGGTLAKIVAESPTPIRAIRPDLPEGLALVIAQCLERQLDQRIRTVGELAVKLSPFAPRESAISVERIVRISGGLDTTFDVPVAAANSGTVQRALETGPQWVRSGSVQTTSPGMSRMAVLLIGTGVGLAVSGGVVGAFILSGNRGGHNVALAESSAPAPAAAPPAVTATAAPTALPADPIEPAQP